MNIVICFICGFCDGSACAIEHQRHFSDKRILSKDILLCVHQTMHDSHSLPSVSVWSEFEVAPYMNMENNLLWMVQGSPQVLT